MENNKAPNSVMYYLGLNFVAPGIGHFAAGYWFRGLLYILLSLGAVLWALWEAVKPLILSVARFLQDSTSDAQLESVNWMYFIRIGIPALLLLLVWIWSMLEIVIITRKKNAAPPPPPENTL